MKTIHLISAGAAQSLATQLKAPFEAQHDCSISTTFGAVGIMKDRLLGGAPCDVLIITEALITQMVVSGDIMAGTARTLGPVKTGVSVKTGEPHPDVSTPAALTAALKAAKGIYFPDPVKSTAGIHFMQVLNELGLHDELADRLRPFPNGATAMKAMAASTETGLLGCTQLTEILYTEGVALVAPLPIEFELATVYSAGVCTRAGEPALALLLIERLAGRESAALRSACGFETDQAA